MEDDTRTVKTFGDREKLTEMADEDKSGLSENRQPLLIFTLFYSRCYLSLPCQYV